MIKIKRGLAIPIAGEPDQQISSGPSVGRVALLGDDYHDMKPTMQVQEGDVVRRGQTLFTDKRLPDVRFTSPAAGKVSQIKRGAKRVFQALVIEVAGDAEERFPACSEAEVDGLDRAAVRDRLLAAGLWPALRTRPFSKTPDPQSTPHALFVTAIDTNPLAARPEVVLADLAVEFRCGLSALRRLTDGKLYLCQAPSAKIPGGELDYVTAAEFDGPHPAGLPGTHIHYLNPVSHQRTVWHIGYQDVAAIGKLLLAGRLPVDRVISLAGPGVKQPRLLRTQLGACLSELTAGELAEGRQRVISGSVLSGRTAEGAADYLGRFHQQVSVIAEGGEREFLGWQAPGFNKFSIQRVFASAWFGGGRKFAFTTSLEGSPRAMVPIGSFERVMPLDILPTQLLRALLTADTEQAQLLGCLELDEEDLSLCDYVCPGKQEYGPLLRRSLTEIERDG